MNFRVMMHSITHLMKWVGKFKACKRSWTKAQCHSILYIDIIILCLIYFYLFYGILSLFFLVDSFSLNTLIDTLFWTLRVWPLMPQKNTSPLSLINLIFHFTKVDHAIWPILDKCNPTHDQKKEHHPSLSYFFTIPHPFSLSYINTLFIPFLYL